MVKAIANETFSIVMEDDSEVKYIKDKEYEYKQVDGGFIIKGENGAAKLSEEDASRNFTRKIFI